MGGLTQPPVAEISAQDLEGSLEGSPTSHLGSMSGGWDHDLPRGELLVHPCAVPKGTVPSRNRSQVIHMSLEMPESPCSRSFEFVRSGTNSVQCLLTVHRSRCSPGERYSRSELPGLYFDFSQTQRQLREGKPHPEAS